MTMAKSNQTTLCYIERDGQYLMMHRVKKQHDINKDKWVGIGGHFEPDESPEECLLRECREETGLVLTDYRLRGVITFISDRWQTEYMFLYTATGYRGKIGDCNEGTLEWIAKDKVYGLPVWEGDKIFFRLLETRRIHGLIQLGRYPEGAAPAVGGNGGVELGGVVQLEPALPFRHGPFTPLKCKV